MGNFNARLEPVTSEVEHVELGKLPLALEQLHNGGGNVGKIGPGVSDVPAGPDRVWT